DVGLWKDYLVVTGFTPGTALGGGLRYHTIRYSSSTCAEIWHADHQTDGRDDVAAALKIAPKAAGDLKAVFVTGTSSPQPTDATNADYHTVKYDLDSPGPVAPEMWLAVYNNPDRNGNDIAADIGQEFIDGPPSQSLVWVTGTSDGTGTGRDI